ncbi:MAG: phosphomannomutase/phosphoglucomutase [Clostridia bacterium]|nr:phosphomannomutase/phosphoglucomutase [Clostridia bacterium]
MEIPKNIFRGYDIRGIYPTEIDREVARKIGLGFATLMKEKGETKIIVGHDNRKSYDDLYQGLTEGITETGMNVIDIGFCVTPMTYFARELLNNKPSIMITASHNPKDYNGFKICGLGRDTIYGEEIQDLRRFIEAGEFASSDIKGIIEKKDIRDDYINYIVDKVKLGDRKLKVAIDCGNGVGSLFAEEIFTKLGCEVLPVCCESDGDFPIHHPDPSQESNMLEFEKFVVENNCDVGLGFDGDADRVIAFDEKGNILFGDDFMAIIWRDLMPKYPGAKGILDVKCTQALYEEIEKLGGIPEFCKVGSSLIKAKIREENLIFAGEYAGHIYFNDEHYGYDDAMYSGARLLRILSNTDKKMSELSEGIPVYPGSPEIIVKVTDDTKAQIVENVKNRFIAEGYEVIDIDGARVIIGHGWGLVRYSNTGPNLTIKSESTTMEAANEIIEQIKKYINEEIAKL